MAKYHLTARPSKATRDRIWYGWRSEGGRRVYRSTGEHLRAEALRVVGRWEAEAERAASGTLEVFAADFFLPGRCPYLAWKAEQGGLKAHTAAEHRKNLRNYILPALGGRLLADIGPVEVETWLRGLPLSGSTRNAILNSLGIVLQEAARARLIREAPRFRRFARRSMRKDILTAGECRALFPDDEEELAGVWRLSERDSTGLMFGVLFRTILHAGLRPGEGKGLHLEQLYPEHCGILVDRQLDSENELAFPKMSSAADPRTRLVVVPQRTMELLQTWAGATGIREGFLFLFNGRPIRTYYLVERFRAGLRAAGIRVGERILVPYSLRYTFRSRAEGAVELKGIMGMMGHRSVGISEHYLRFDPAQFEALKPYREAIESLW